MSQQTCPPGTYFSIARGRCVPNDVLAPTPWRGEAPAPTAECSRWVLMSDGATYTCAPDAWHPASSGPDWGRVALVGLGLAAVVGVGIFVVRSM